jgi:uncharacterized protein YprB with RNaseH-like and TPR domain
MAEAYLDIETTGLDFSQRITVIGIYIEEDGEGRMVQLVGDDILADALHDALAGVETIYTYNGSRFDLPFIHARLGTNLCDRCHHHDLMYDCWKQGLRGGLKKVEIRLGIDRDSSGISGLDAVRLWYRYKSGDKSALKILLDYNRDDCQNLKLLRDKLNGEAWRRGWA